MKVIVIVCDTVYKSKSFLALNALFSKSVTRRLALIFGTTYKWYMCLSLQIGLKHKSFINKMVRECSPFSLLLHFLLSVYLDIWLLRLAQFSS